MAMMQRNVVAHVAARATFVRPAMMSKVSQARLQALHAVPQKKAAPEPADEFDEDEFDEDGTVFEQRRVEYLRELQAKYDEANRDYQKELTQLRMKYEKVYAPIYDERVQVVAGTKAVPDYGLEAVEGEVDEGVAMFWALALSNNQEAGSTINERDFEVLKFVEDIRCESYIEDESMGFTIRFYFKENPFFKNKVLTKDYRLEIADEPIPQKFTGSTIEWFSQDKNVTLEAKTKRVKSASKGGKSATVKEYSKVASFFNWFNPAEIPDDSSQLSDDDLALLQEELDGDFEIGIQIRDSIIPRALEWFKGELSSPEDMYGEYDDEEYEEYK